MINDRPFRIYSIHKECTVDCRLPSLTSGYDQTRFELPRFNLIFFQFSDYLYLFHEQEA